MGLGKELSDDFKDRCKSMVPHPRGEVKLFELLIDSFKSLRSYDIAEIHGTKAIVEYVEDQGWFTKTPRCELGDIFFLVYSPSREKARYFVMQNKVQCKRSYTQVHTSLVQHELLATKKTFEFTNTHTTSDMFSHARHDSVCVYGNFYESSTGMMDDMSAFTASKLVFKGATPHRVASKYPTKEVEYNGMMDDVATMRTACASGTSKDFDGTDNLEKFGDLIEELYVGEPLGLLGLKAVVTMLRSMPEESYNNTSGKTLEELCEELDEMATRLESAQLKTDELENGKLDKPDDVRRNKQTEIDFLMVRCKQIVFINCDRRNER